MSLRIGLVRWSSFDSCIWIQVLRLWGYSSVFIRYSLNLSHLQNLTLCFSGVSTEYFQVLWALLQLELYRLPLQFVQIDWGIIHRKNISPQIVLPRFWIMVCGKPRMKSIKVLENNKFLIKNLLLSYILLGTSLIAKFFLIVSNKIFR